jgi:hypothetical protein
MTYGDNDLTAPDSPVLNLESLVVQPEGELPRGLYYYVITALTPTMESCPSHTLQVLAPYKNNSISFEWKFAEGVSEYRIYRSTILGQYDGFFTVYSVANICYFCDNGMGILNEDTSGPPYAD